MKTWSRLSTALVSTSLFVSCASIHEGNYATVAGKQPNVKGTSNKGTLTDSKVLVSGKEIDDMSSQYFAMIDFTFENKSSKWVTVQKVTLDFGSEKANAMIQIPVGEQLVAWADAAQQNKAIEDHNTAMAIASIAAVGATLSAASSDNKTKMAGSAVTLGAAGVLTAKGIKEGINQLSISKIVPDSHLLSPVFTIPPGLHAKKWITLYTQKPLTTPFVSEIGVTMHLSNGKTETIKLPFRTSQSGLNSKWQKGHYYSPQAVTLREQKRYAGQFSSQTASAKNSSNEVDPATTEED